jgi:hypothetical protein
MRYALILSLAVFLVGCFEEPTLTWTTDVELTQSIENVRESLPDSQQAIFMDAIYLYQTANDPASKPSFDHIEDVVERMEAERNAYDFVADMLEAYPHRQISIEDLRGKTGEQILEAYRSVIKERDAHVAEIEAFELELKEALKTINSDYQATYNSLTRLKEKTTVPAFIERIDAGLDSAVHFHNTRLVKSYTPKIEAALDINNFERAYQIAKDLEAAIMGDGFNIYSYHYDKALKKYPTWREGQEYLQNYVEITEFTTRRIDTYRRDNAPAIRVAARNNGDRTINELTVTVYLKDADGKRIHEEKIFLATDNPYIYDKPPLKPGYVFEMEADHYRIVKQPLNAWKTGSAEYEVTEIELAPNE